MPIHDPKIGEHWQLKYPGYRLDNHIFKLLEKVSDTDVFIENLKQFKALDITDNKIVSPINMIDQHGLYEWFKVDKPEVIKLKPRLDLIDI
jgi:hypothetical protein